MTRQTGSWILAITALIAVGLAIGFAWRPQRSRPPRAASLPAAAPRSDAVERTNDEWRKVLTPEQFYVMRQAGTEPAFTGENWDTKSPGVYGCAACGEPLFGSDSKYDSGTGWPSFWQPIAESHIKAVEDGGLFFTGIEVRCSKCDSHLGHVFDDGPEPTGLRYCINSVALKFEEK